jgi:hypothetical protein
MTLIEQFETLTLDDINHFISTNQEENLLLDFKLVNNADLSHSNDKKNLAKALSGFANSSGGLIVWGVDARKNAQDVDCAVGTREIEPLSLLISRLNEFTGRAVNPIVEGVRHRPITVSADRGFAVTLVPESDSGHHMAKLGEDRYYKRSGDSFYRMEHFDLEDMFGRRKKPKLRLVARVSRPRDEVVIGILNEGRGTAKAPYLSFSIPTPFTLSRYGIDGNGNEGLPRLHHGGNDYSEPRYGANSNTVIHPNTIHDVTKIDFRGREENRPGGEIMLEYEIAAEDMQITKSRLVVNLDKPSLTYNK